MIAVFLSNKLITCDVIVPIMLEVRVACGSRRIAFYCFEKRTYDAIRSNVVLNDAIASMGTLAFMGRSQKGRLSWLIHRIRMAVAFLPLAARAVAGGVVFVHFKALSEWPLRVLFFLNRRRTFLFEPSVAAYSKLADEVVANMFRQRRRKTIKPAAGKIVAFDPAWPVLADDRLQGVPRFMLSSPHRRKAWLDFIDRRIEGYLQADFAAAGVAESEDIVVFILSLIDPEARGADFMKANIRLSELLAETLDILSEEAPDLAIFVKPHVITDMDYLAEVVAARPDARIVVTHLHPCALAMRAKFFVANYYSTTFASAQVLNGITVEYTDYADEILEATGGGSMRPDFVDHFINNDPRAFRALVRRLANAPRPALPHADSADPDGVIERLCA